MKKIGCKIKLGDRLEWFLELITFGNSHYWSYLIARRLGYKDCGCEKRRKWLNRLTCNELKYKQ